MIFLDIGLLQLYTRHTMTTNQMTTITQLANAVKKLRDYIANSSLDGAEAAKALENILEFADATMKPYRLLPQKFLTYPPYTPISDDEDDEDCYDNIPAADSVLNSRVNSQELEDKVLNDMDKEDDESKTALVAFVNGAAERNENWGKDTWFEYTDDELMTLAGDFLKEDKRQTKTDLIQFIIRYVMQ